MSGFDHFLNTIDNRLVDPHSRTPSMSFHEQEMKNYTDLFKNNKNLPQTTWAPALSSPTSMLIKSKGEYFLSRPAHIQAKKHRLKQRKKETGSQAQEL